WVVLLKLTRPRDPRIAHGDLKVLAFPIRVVRGTRDPERPDPLARRLEGHAFAPLARVALEPKRELNRHAHRFADGLARQLAQSLPHIAPAGILKSVRLTP